MSNPEAARIMEHLERLVGMGIRLHAQLVILRGLNDGPSLQRTLRDLDSLGENMMSVGVVPAVYTRYRKAPPSPAPDPKWAGETLQLIEDYASGARKRRGDNWAYGADEPVSSFGTAFPPYEYYGDFHQYENGIGIVPEFRRCLEIELGSGVGEPGCAPDSRSGGRRFLPARYRRNRRDGRRRGGEGGSVYGAGRLHRGISCENVFFGDTVTAAGLLTGRM